MMMVLLLMMTIAMLVATVEAPCSDVRQEFASHKRWRRKNWGIVALYKLHVVTSGGGGGSRSSSSG
jgi:hypothetical protein